MVTICFASSTGGDEAGGGLVRGCDCDGVRAGLQFASAPGRLVDPHVRDAAGTKERGPGEIEQQPSALACKDFQNRRSRWPCITRVVGHQVEELRLTDGLAVCLAAWL